jgi:hypothetical protein
MNYTVNLPETLPPTKNNRHFFENKKTLPKIQNNPRKYAKAAKFHQKNF